MDTSFWGPFAWRFLHAVTFDYPIKPSDVNRQQYKTFFESLQYVLPCPECRNHFRQGLQSHPIEQHLQSREALSRYLVDFHNRVNVRLGKPVVDYETVKEIYVQEQTQCSAQGCSSQKNLTSQRHLKIQTALLCCILLLLTIIIVANVTKTT